MKKLILGLLLLLSYSGWGQVSVFDCNTYSKTLSQAKLDANSSFFNTCFEMGITNAVSIQGDAHKTIEASSQIHLKDSVHIGAFTNEGQTHLLISHSPALDIVVMNYDKLDVVLRYKKLELGIPLPADINDKIANFINNTGADSLRLNPFLEWDIDVEASFYTDNWAETVNGFYTREYQQNNQTHDWDDIGTDYPFRIRFAPPRNGEWKSQVVIKVKGQIVYKSNIFFFNVIESGHPGYVHVHENNRNLKRGNRMIFPVGQNFPNIGDANCTNGSYGDIVPNTEKCTNTEEWNNYLHEVETYFTLGNQYGDPNKPKFIRFVAMPWSSAIEFEEKGNYYKRLHYASEIDKLIDLCEEYDGLMIYDLMYQSQFMYRNYWWQWCWEHVDKNGNHLPEYGPSSDYPFYCYNDDPGINGGSKKPHEMFTNTSDLNYHKQRTRYLIARYGYSTQIYEWEILSEPWHLDERPEAEKSPFQDSNHPDHSAVKHAVKNYHEVISDYIKDTLNWSRQLVGIDMGYHDGTFDTQSIGLKNIDIVGFNPYYTSPNELIKSDNNTMKGYVDAINMTRDGYNLDPVPVIIPEGGIDNDYSECSNYDLRSVDEMTLGFTGVAGFHFWDGSSPKEDGTYHTELWKNTFRAQNHMNGDDVINTLSEGGGYWGHGMGVGYHKDSNEVEAVEMQAYISSNKKLIVGYVRNRSFNVYTNGSSGSICKDIGYDDNGNTSDYSPVNNHLNFQWDDIRNSDQLKVEGLLITKKYDVNFYGDNNGMVVHIGYDSKLSSLSGRLKLRYPELYIEEHWQNRPVIWFVAKREGYNGMMQNNDIVEDSTDVFLKQFLSLAEDTLTQKNSLRVYPNPFEDYFTVESPVDDEIVIQDPSGRIVLQQKISKEQNRIQTERLRKGIYFVQFVNQSRTFKIIKR